ncbi:MULTISPECIES: hypothetical protein [unclassified Sphingomonas]|jgi:hypothetical protein|uniref:hypothetical protein n=1 Tax=unclassified Sphingomonas TaxID=196159 RepID=UPI00082C35D5|nr:MULTISPECIES: hypothetical protein [unclassified Sphingomonas]
MALFWLIPPILVFDRPNSSNGQSRAPIIIMYGNPTSNAAVLAQELAEFTAKWLLLYLPAIAVAWLAWRHVHFIAPALILPPAFVIQRLPPLRRQLELLGHEVEAQAAELLYGTPAAEVRKWEVVALARPTNYGGVFKDWSDERIGASLSARAGIARRAARLFMPILTRFKRRYR